MLEQMSRRWWASSPHVLDEETSTKRRPTLTSAGGAEAGPDARLPFLTPSAPFSTPPCTAATPKGCHFTAAWELRAECRFRKDRETRSISPQAAVYSFGHACQDVAPFSKWESSWLRPHQSPAEAREAGAEGSWTRTVAHGWLARLILNTPDAPFTWFDERKHLLS